MTHESLLTGSPLLGPLLGRICSAEPCALMPPSEAFTAASSCNDCFGTAQDFYAKLAIFTLGAHPTSRNRKFSRYNMHVTVHLNLRVVQALNA